MKLEDAIAYSIEKEGIGIITEKRFLNYLNDLQALSTSAVKRIIATMIEEGYFDKLQPYLNVAENNYELQFQDVESRLVSNEGFQADLVHYVLHCLLYAAHKSNDVPQFPSFTAPTLRKRSTTLQKPDIKIIQENGNFVVDINNDSFKLDESQYKAILRKKDAPADRLAVWLKSYEEESNTNK